MINKYAVDKNASDTVSRKTQKLLRILQLEGQGLADRAAKDTAIADLRRELDDPSVVVNIIAVVESKSS